MSITPTKRQLHSEEMRKKIGDAAEELIYKYGFEKVSMKDIAAHIGVTTGAVYHHFKNKESVLEEIFQRHSAEFDDLYESYQNTTDPLGDIRCLLSEIMAERVLNDGFEFTRYRVFSIMRFENVSCLDRCIELLVQKAFEKKQLRHDLQPDVVSDFITSVYRGAVYQYCVSSIPVDLKAMIKQRLDIALYGLQPLENSQFHV